MFVSHIFVYGLNPIFLLQIVFIVRRSLRAPLQMACFLLQNTRLGTYSWAPSCVSVIAQSALRETRGAGQRQNNTCYKPSIYTYLLLRIWAIIIYAGGTHSMRRHHLGSAKHPRARRIPAGLDVSRGRGLGYQCYRPP